jgi:DNA-binding transcriptional ArsR family regulator
MATDAEKSSTSNLVAKLTAEIRAIDVKIVDLTAERHALTRILERTKSELFTAAATTRKNSFSKVVVEQEILQTLRRRLVPVSSADLLAAARTVRYDLRPETFRSHLHRLKAKGLIENAAGKRRGYWSIISRVAQNDEPTH